MSAESRDFPDIVLSGHMPCRQYFEAKLFMGKVLQYLIQKWHRREISTMFQGNQPERRES